MALLIVFCGFDVKDVRTHTHTHVGGKVKLIAELFERNDILPFNSEIMTLKPF